MMSFGTAIGLFYKNYVNFEGRASRAEYWWPTLMRSLVYMTLFIAFLFVVGSNDFEDTGEVDVAAGAIMIAIILFYLVNFLPCLSIKVRRFHDLEQTGWLVPVFWAANLVVPLVEFARLIWFAFPGTFGPNQYGSDSYRNDVDVFG